MQIGSESYGMRFSHCALYLSMSKLSDRCLQLGEFWGVRYLQIRYRTVQYRFLQRRTIHSTSKFKGVGVLCQCALSSGPQATELCLFCNDSQCVYRFLGSRMYNLQTKTTPKTDIDFDTKRSKKLMPFKKRGFST